MRPFLYNFFHNETVDRTERGMVRVPRDPAEWPQSWKTIEYKKYALFPHIPLSGVQSFLFDSLLQKRRSSEGFTLENALSLQKLSNILKCGYGLQNDPAGGVGRAENRTVPSAGKRYPLEIYVLLFRPVDNCPAGVYHYGTKEHALEPILFRDFSNEDLLLLSPLEWLKDTWGMFCITSAFHRTVDKYGSRGYRFLLLEAGHVAQNMILAGTESAIHMVPIGGVNDGAVEDVLRLQSKKERMLYALYF